MISYQVNYANVYDYKKGQYTQTNFVLDAQDSATSDDEPIPS